MARKIDILVIGLEHVLPKVANWYAALADEGIGVALYSGDRYGVTQRIRSKLPVPVFLVPEFAGRASRWFIGIPFLVFLVFWLRPRHVEVYDPEIGGRFWTTCISLLQRLRVRMVILNRGGAFGHAEQSPQERLWVSRLYNNAHFIIYKELYMKDLFVREYGLRDVDKLLLVHNRVKVGPEPAVDRQGNPVVLYLNNFRRWKRPDLCVEAAALVRQQIPDVEFLLVGDVPDTELSSAKYRDSVWSVFSGGELRALAKQLGITEQVRILDFTENPMPYYERAWVFLFPADLVFCNFSLLEAMERGVPAIISDVKDGERIVEDGVNGFRVPQTAEAIADKVIALLGNESLRQAMGRAARAKIVSDYNVADTARQLAQAYRERVWVA